MLGLITLLSVAVTGPAAGEPGPRPREARLDRNGDPLPPGAVARFGPVPPLPGGAADIAWAPDGCRFLLTDGTTVLTLDATTGRTLDRWAFATDSRGVRPRLSRDGRFLFRPYGNKWILTDATSGEPVITHRWPPPLRGIPIGPECLSANARFVAGVTGSPDKPGIPWRYDLATTDHLPIADRADVTSLLLSPDGRQAYGTTGPDRPRLIAWDVAAGRELWSVALGHQPTVRSVSPDGRRVAVGERGQFGVAGREPDMVRVFDAARGREVWSVPHDQPPIDGPRTVDFSPDGRLLAVRKRDEVVVWDLDLGRMLHRLSHAADRVAFAPDGRSLLTVSWWAQRWDLLTGRPVFPAPVCDRAVAPAVLRWSDDGSRLLTIWPGDRSDKEQDRTPDLVAVWDVRTSAVVGRLASTSAVRAATPGPDGTTIRVLSADGRLTVRRLGLFGTETTVPLRSPPGTRDTQTAAFLPDGKLMVRGTVRPGVRVQVYDPSGNPMHKDEVAWPKSPAGRAAEGLLQAHTILAQDGQRVDLLTGQPLPPLVAPAPISQVVGFPLPTDGPFVAGRVQFDRDTAGFLWESASGRAITPLPPHLPDWNVAAVSPDGRWLASADRAFIILFDLRDASPWRLPAAGVKCIAFSPDGRRVATAHADSTVVIWDVPAAGRAEWKSADADRLWADLAADARPAWVALWHLLDHPERAAELLTARLKPVPIWIDTHELIARLDHPRYAVREGAARELTRRGPDVANDLRAARKVATTAEQRERLDGLLRQLTPAHPPDGEVLRGLRAVWLLERLETAKGKELLERLAGGESGSPVTREAQAALGRMR